MTEDNQAFASQNKDLMNSMEEKDLESDPELTNTKDSSSTLYPKWVNNQGEEVKEVFGFNKNAELINARAAMFGFAMLLITELVFRGEPVTHAIFGIG